MPPKIENAPELQVGLGLFLNAFFELTTTRQIGFGGEGSIGWDKVLLYCDAHDIVEEQRDDMFYHIAHLDSAYLSHRRDKAEKEREATKTKGAK